MSGLTRHALAGCIGAALLFASGCQDKKIKELESKIQEQETIILKYEKENRDLMAQVEGRSSNYLQLQEELRGKDREIDLLMQKLRERREAAPRRDVWGSARRKRLEFIANKVGGTVTGNRIQLPGDFLFDSGKWTLKAGAKQTIRDLASELLEDGFGLMIVGHTDSDPIKASAKRGVKSNRHLSVLRGLAVLEYMKEECGYPPDLMYPTGWGELYPAAANSTKAGKARNRRVEIYVDPELSNLFKRSVAVGVSAAGSVGAAEPVTRPAGEDDVLMPPLK